jgi:hypothetical protein
MAYVTFWLLTRHKVLIRATVKDQSYDVQFVGPSVGTHGPGNLNTARPSPPLLPEEPEPTYPDIIGGSSL